MPLRSDKAQSDCHLCLTHFGELDIFLLSFIINFFMVKARERRSDSMSFSHFEILPKVLVSAPPVGPDHAQSLVPSHLMEV